MSELYLEGYTQNRELSWLKFNERVLLEAGNSANPLLERIRFLGIYESNLAEFIRVRVGSLHHLSRVDHLSRDSMSGMTASEQINSIWKEIRRIHAAAEQILLKIYDDLKQIGAARESSDSLKAQTAQYLDGQFMMRLARELEPNFVEVGNLAEMVEDGKFYVLIDTDADNNRTLMLVELPDSWLQGVVIGRGDIMSLLPPMDILHRYIARICFPFVPRGSIAFRAFRNADIDFEYDEFEFGAGARERIRKMLEKRTDSEFVGTFVCTDYSSSGLCEILCEALTLPGNELVQCSELPTVKHLVHLQECLTSKTVSANSYRRFAAAPSNCRNGESVIACAMDRDILDAYPYESMDNLLELLKEASSHPKVKEIRISIYRLSNHPRIYEYLIKAAHNGKCIKVLIELRARFDESSNIDWAKRLEEAGCHVYYGTKSYKSHFKTCQVIFRKSFNKSGANEIITQVGTGNYNESTAKQYTDFSVITANHLLGLEVMRLFDDAVRGIIDDSFQYILASPGSLRKGIVKLIDREIEKGSAGRIFIKVNSVTDRAIIEKLAEASVAGVKIRMLVRGSCTLLPGVSGYTENVQILSIVGRFLEHSRVYIFGSDDDEITYISSADLMNRNMDKRFELAFPITDRAAISEIKHIMYENLTDNVRARCLRNDGRYAELRVDGIMRDSQERLLYQFNDHID